MSTSTTSHGRLSKPGVLLLIGVVSLAGQLIFSTLVPPHVSLAGASGLSAALGLVHGQGMTIAPKESLAIKFRTQPDDEIRNLYDPESERMPLIEPLPGIVLFYFVLLGIGLPVTLNLIAHINVAFVAAATVFLADELMHRRKRFGLIAGLALAAFVPLYRMSMVVGYDVFEFIFIVLAVVLLLKFLRTSATVWLILNAAVLGAGLWIRSYFILYVIAHAAIVSVVLLRASGRRRLLAGWIAPVLVLAGLMIAMRDTGSTGTPLTRGAFWHSFWMGVGQFENTEITGFTDWDVCDLARDLGHGVTCDRSYESEGTPYLFQYGIEYNRILGKHGRTWIAENPDRFLANAMIRLCWLAVPGLMHSSAAENRPLVAALLILFSVVLLFFASVGIVAWSREKPTEMWVVLGTYLALAPLSAYYLIAKVVTVSYFCVLTLAGAGLEAIRHRFVSGGSTRAQ